MCQTLLLLLLLMMMMMLILDYAVIQWLKRNTIDRLSIEFSSKRQLPNVRGVWEERKDAEADISAYLSEYPSE